eukprot:TRINITY_DN3788_c1_g1_i1.p1 TRINITY_DN3788_c1_g1~~TRINITY_DN3788_c1_g1_i1.p1  ORF type:complete len:484 (+),score=71.00 TRINITY_DN3788_c1_g1_i1:57-1454(+)
MSLVLRRPLLRTVRVRQRRWYDPGAPEEKFGGQKGAQPEQKEGESAKDYAKRTAEWRRQHPLEYEYDGSEIKRTEAERFKYWRSLSWNDTMDSKGGVDLFEYFYGQWFRVNKPISSALEYTFGYKSYSQSETSQPDNPAYQRFVKRRQRERDLLSGKPAERWNSAAFVGVPEGSFRISGGAKTGQRPGKDGYAEPDQDEAKEEETPKVEEPPPKAEVRVPNPYRVLQLPPVASERHAADNYKKLARRFHPDAPEGSEEKMTELNLAYELVRKIIKEGGLEKSPTARAEMEKEGIDEETVKKAEASKRSSDGRTPSQRKYDEWQAGTDPMPGLASLDDEEREELRRMAHAFRTQQVRATDQRRANRAERRRRFLAGARRMTGYKHDRRIVMQLGTALALFVYGVNRFLWEPHPNSNFRVYEAGTAVTPNRPALEPPSVRRKRLELEESRIRANTSADAAGAEVAAA